MAELLLSNQILQRRGNSYPDIVGGVSFNKVGVIVRNLRLFPSKPVSPPCVTVGKTVHFCKNPKKIIPKYKYLGIYG